MENGLGLFEPGYGKEEAEDRRLWDEYGADGIWYAMRREFPRGSVGALERRWVIVYHGVPHGAPTYEEAREIAKRLGQSDNLPEPYWREPNLLWTVLIVTKRVPEEGFPPMCVCGRPLRHEIGIEGNHTYDRKCGKCRGPTVRMPGDWRYECPVDKWISSPSRVQLGKVE
jgi:hypothetical protein